MRSAQRGSDPAAALALAAGEPFYANLFTGYAVQHSETVYFDRLRSNQEDLVDTDTKSSRSVPETARDTSPLEVILVLFLLLSDSTLRLTFSMSHRQRKRWCLQR
jgi:hypothetical protein